MSLLEALLLDPHRMNVWLAKRTDGIDGTGTQNDPYDGSTAAKFDTVMNGLAANTCVHLGPGEFETRGYYDGITGTYWQAKAGMRVVGSGIDVTTLKLVNTSATTQRVYAIGHALSSSTVDFFEVRDLTINCNYVPTQGSSWTAGAVRILGNHSRVVRVKVRNWGNKSTGTPGFVVAMLTGLPGTVSGVINCGIEECIAIEPHASTAGKVTVLHCGGKEDASTSSEAFGLGPYIRNCFVDCGQVSDLTKDYRALSMAWCKGGVVEGNQVHNTRHGGTYQTDTGARDLVVRNNVYRNVCKGPYWSLGAQGVQRLIVEGNSIELATGGANTEYAIHLDSSQSPPTYVHGTVIIRGNRIRYLDGGSGSRNGIRVVNARNLLVRENVLEVSPAQPEYPVNSKNCESVEYFENRTPAGVLLRGFNDTGSSTTEHPYNELETEAEEAFILGMIRKR